jgi:hypothetical protein
MSTGRRCLKSRGRGRIVPRVALGAAAEADGRLRIPSFPPWSQVPCWLRPEDLTECFTESFRG